MSRSEAGRQTRGVTLVELIIALALTGALTLGAYGLIRAGLAAFGAATGEYDCRTASAAALTAISRAARSDAGFSPSRYTLRDGVLYDGESYIAGPVSDFSITVGGGLVRVFVTTPDGAVSQTAVRAAAGPAS